MDIKEMQKIVDDCLKNKNLSYWKPNNLMLRLMEDVGELSREINWKFGEKPKKATEEGKEFGYEIADILFTLVCLANSLDINLEEAFNQIMKKYENK